MIDISNLVMSSSICLIKLFAAWGAFRVTLPKMSSKVESDVCCRLQVAPSGESYEGNAGLAESNGRLLLGGRGGSRK